MKKLLLKVLILFLIKSASAQHAVPYNANVLFVTGKKDKPIGFYGADTLIGSYLRIERFQLTPEIVSELNRGITKIPVTKNRNSTQINDSIFTTPVPSKLIRKIYFFKGESMLDVFNEYENNKYYSDKSSFLEGSFKSKKLRKNTAYLFYITPGGYKSGKRLFKEIQAIDQYCLLDSTTVHHYSYPGSFEVMLNTETVDKADTFLNAFNLRFKGEAYFEFFAGGPGYLVARIECSEEFSKKFTLFPKYADWKPSKWPRKIEVIVKDKNEVLRLIEGLKYD